MRLRQLFSWGRNVSAGLLLCLVTVVISNQPANATIYYIDNSATGCGGSGCSNANNGTSKATAWVAAPGMPTCNSGVCAATTPVAGDQFIFRGGDTWGASNFSWDWTWSGAGTGGVASNPIYIGVDQTWFTGASWTRPIFTCGGTACAARGGGLAFDIFRAFNVNYITIDNIEWTGLATVNTGVSYASGIGDREYIVFLGLGIEIKNNYMHGWSHVAWGNYTVATLPASPALWDLAHVTDNVSNCQVGGGIFDAICQWNGTNWVDVGPNTYGIRGSLSNGSDALLGTLVHDNVIDGSDTTQDDGLCISNAASIYNNVCRYVFNGLNGASDNLYSNLVEHVDFHAASGLHCNEVYDKGYIDSTAKTKRIYNNRIQHNAAAGCVIFYVNDLVNCPTCTTYFYNNIIYDTAGGDPVVSVGGSSAGTSAGTVNAYNNTIASGSLSCMGNGLNGTNAQTLNYDNNHCITSAGSVANCGTIITCTDGGHNLLRTQAQAASDCTAGSNCYVATGTYAYSPQAGGTTIGVGANLTSSVATIGLPFGNDTLYGCSLGAGNVTVCPSRTANARPNAAWDVGAYEFSAGGSAGSGTLSSSLATVLHGQTYTLTWTTANCSSASIDQGIGAVSCAGGTTSPITMSGTKTYTLTVVGAGGNGTASVTVTQGGMIFRRDMKVTTGIKAQ